MKVSEDLIFFGVSYRFFFPPPPNPLLPNLRNITSKLQQDPKPPHSETKKKKFSRRRKKKKKNQQHGKTLERSMKKISNHSMGGREEGGVSERAPTSPTPQKRDPSPPPEKKGGHVLFIPSGRVWELGGLVFHRGVENRPRRARFLFFSKVSFHTCS